MNASDRQVGGSHYRVKKGGVGHWDYCVEVNVPYLEGCATKYLTRWRKKNGLQDLEKVEHFIQKRLESWHTHVGILKGANKKEALFKRFCEDNSIPHEERCIIDQVMHWKRPDQLIAAIEMVRKLIIIAKEEEGQPTSAYVNQDR